MQKDLWRHFENRERGVNVWQLSDGSFVQDTATPENSNTTMTAVYPWDVNNPQAPYVRAIFIDSGANPQSPTEHDTVHSPYPVAFFQGGASHVVTAAQAALLEAYTSYGTGYSDCIVTS